MKRKNQLTLKDLITSIKNGAYLEADVNDLIRDYGDIPIIAYDEFAEYFVEKSLLTKDEIVLTIK